MGIRILGGVLVNESPDRVGACLYDSTTMEVFGPIFDDTEAAEEFLDWYWKEHGSSGQAKLHLMKCAKLVFDEEYMPILRAERAKASGAN